MKRVCHVCAGHSVDDGRVFHRSCVALAEAGYDVHLIAQGTATSEYRQSGVTIHPLKPWESRAERLRARGRIARLAADLRADIYHVHEPELLGPVLSRAGGARVIWDVHESYLDVLRERSWIPRLLRPAACRYWDLRERQLIRGCVGIVVVTDQIAERYRKLHDNVCVIRNYPDLPRMTGEPQERRDRTCVFAGALGPDRGLSQVIRAQGLLRGRGIDARLVLAGKPASAQFLQSLLEEAERVGVPDLVDYRGVISKADAEALQRTASIGLVPYLPVGNSVVGMPTKLVECMAFGLPVIYSHFAGYIQTAGSAGIAVDPTSPTEIAAAIEWLVQHPEKAREMGREGRRRVSDGLSWQAEKQKLLQFYEKCEASGDARHTFGRDTGAADTSTAGLHS